MINEKDIKQISKLLNKNHPNAKSIRVFMKFGTDNELEIKVID